ncbi:diacylglycerol kinase [Pararhizobium capsulatum]|nr:diacylglycerol kinase [Pararhizobium capsulatum]
MTSTVPKLTSVRHFFAAAQYSASGAVRAWKEAAFRHEVFGFLVLVAIYGWIGASGLTLVAALILFLLLLAVEAINTAIEEIIDRISPEISATGRHAKDLGSFSVFCLLCANGILLLYTIGTSLLP